CGRWRRSRRKIIEPKKLMFPDLQIRPRSHRACPAINDEERNVVAGKLIEVRIECEQSWLTHNDDTRLLLEFALHGLPHRLTLLNTTTGEVPTWAVAMSHEQHLRPLVPHQGLCSEGDDPGRTLVPSVGIRN